MVCSNIDCACSYTPFVGPYTNNDRPQEYCKNYRIGTYTYGFIYSGLDDNQAIAMQGPIRERAVERSSEGRNNPISNERRNNSPVSALTTTSRGSSYSDKDRYEAATLYAIHGQLSPIVKATGIPQQTLTDWKKTEWWDGLVSELRSSRQDEHISRYHTLAEKAIEAAERGIDGLAGDKLSASDIRSLATVGAISTDKARLLANQPTSISGKSSDLTALAERFKAIEADSRRIKADHDAIQGSVVSTVDNDNENGSHS